MTVRYLSLVLLFVSLQSCFAQDVDFKLIEYNGLKFISTKTQIKEKLGNPNKIFKPNYECGFLSEYEQNTEYFSLDYGAVKFTGNEKEKYLIELIDFENNNTIVLKYGSYYLTCDTTLKDLALIFGEYVKKQLGKGQNGGVILFHKKSDDGLRIEVKNGKLIRFGYWSPC